MVTFGWPASLLSSDCRSRGLQEAVPTHMQCSSSLLAAIFIAREGFAVVLTRLSSLLPVRGADVVGVVGVLLYGDARGFYGKYIIFSGTFVVVVVDVFCFHLLFATLRIVYT